MSDQLTFSSLAYNSKKKVTRRERFLKEMDAVIPWGRLKGVVEPVYPDIGNGRPPIGLERMLRIYFMQQWFQLSDPGMEDSLYDSESIRRFAGIELGCDVVPDESTILRFRHLLEEHDLTTELFHEVNSYLEERGLMLREGTIVDATIINAPTSTKNKAGKRDPEMHQVRKSGKEWRFGMKAHIGTDMERGLVHTVVCTPANIHDSRIMDELLHGNEKQVYGDSAYWSKARKEKYESKGLLWRVNKQALWHSPLTKKERRQNKRRSRTRARVEHVFGVVKHLWGYSKTRYRGIDKNAAQQFTLFALANLYLTRKTILNLQPGNA